MRLIINTTTSRDSLVRITKAAEGHFMTMQTLAQEHLQVSSEQLEVSKGSLEERKRTKYVVPRHLEAASNSVLAKYSRTVILSLIFLLFLKHATIAQISRTVPSAS